MMRCGSLASFLNEQFYRIVRLSSEGDYPKTFPEELE